MALSLLATTTINNACRAADQLLAQVKPVLDELDTLYNAGGGLKTTIQDADLQGAAAYSGLTKTQLDDGLYALTATLKNDLANAYAALVQLAARA